jgi:hypothetical protein
MKEEFYCSHCHFLTSSPNIIKGIKNAGGFCPVCHKDPKTATYLEAHDHVIRGFFEMAKPTKEDLDYLTAKRIVLEYEHKHPRIYLTPKYPKIKRSNL